MSKMKRKWLRVIEYEENGQQIDNTTRQQLLETHPDLPLLQQEPTIATHATGSSQSGSHDFNTEAFPIQNNLHDPLNDPLHNLPHDDEPSTTLQPSQNQNQSPFHQSHSTSTFPDDQDHAIHPDLILTFSNPPEDAGIQPNLVDHAQPPEEGQEFLDSQQIDARLERQIQDEIANATATAAAAVAVAEGGS
jgi:hypothetical protein